jgi:hypothetical protein
MIIDTEDPLLNAEMFIDPQYLSFFCPNVFMLYINSCACVWTEEKKTIFFFHFQILSMQLTHNTAYESIIASAHARLHVLL